MVTTLLSRKMQKKFMRKTRTRILWSAALYQKKQATGVGPVSSLMVSKKESLICISVNASTLHTAWHLCHVWMVTVCYILFR